MTFQFNIDQKYFPGYKVTNQYAKVHYSVAGNRIALHDISFHFSTLAIITLTPEFLDEVLIAANNNAVSMGYFEEDLENGFEDRETADKWMDDQHELQLSNHEL